MELSSSSGGLSVRTVRDAHPPAIDTSAGVSHASQQSSPRSSALPSPPDSPGSLSSSPSFSSSFFFSSVTASPRHNHAHIEQDRESAQGLIIPSLTLPVPLRQPTPYGKTVGDVRILVFGNVDPGASSFIAGMLLEDNEDIVDVMPSEVTNNGHVLVRASTDWAEHRDAHGLEKFEPTHNVEIIDVSKHASAGEPDHAIARILAIIHEPFQDLLDVIDPACPPSALLSNLISSSSSSPLYTALVVSPLSVSSRHRAIIDGLGAHIPVILLPSTGLPRAQLPISAFRPSSVQALRTGIFCSPETLNLLRNEAVDRFLRWREIERAASTVHESRSNARSKQQGVAWDKAAWETEWDATLSRDVARRLRENTATSAPGQTHVARNPTCTPALLDPFHIPSLVMVSLSLFTPVKDGIAQMSLSGKRLGFVLVSTLCAGVGIGLALRAGF